MSESFGAVTAGAQAKRIWLPTSGSAPSVSETVPVEKLIEPMP